MLQHVGAQAEGMPLAFGRRLLTSSQHLSPAFLARLISMASSTSFVLEDHRNVQVSLAGSSVQDLTKEELKDWPPFKVRLPRVSSTSGLFANSFQKWITNLSHSLALQSCPDHPFHDDPFHLRDITIDSYSRFGKRIGFLKLSANVSNAADTRLPGVIFLRGPAVAMLVVLIPNDQPADSLDEAYALLTVQPRIATGSLSFVELPAGMMDDENSFAGVAAREIEEELGLVIKQEELTSLTDKVAEIRSARGEKKHTGNNSTASNDKETLPFAMYTSAGGCDEYIKIFFHERRVPRHTLREWEGKYGGLRDSGELITLKIVSLEDLWLEGGMDSKALAAVTLYKQYKIWKKKNDGQHS